MFVNYGDFTAGPHPDGGYRTAVNQSGKDWYDLLADLGTTSGPSPFNLTWTDAGEPKTYLVVSTRADGARFVRLAGNDPTRMFPVAASFVAVDQIPEPNMLNGKLVDLVTGELSDPPLVLMPVILSKADIWRRATDEEAETIDAALQAQPVRLRNLFRDAQYLSSEDELFPLLVDALVSAFGEERAAELLAPTP